MYTQLLQSSKASVMMVKSDKENYNEEPVIKKIQIHHIFMPQNRFLLLSDTSCDSLVEERSLISC